MMQKGVFLQRKVPFFFGRYPIAVAMKTVALAKTQKGRVAAATRPFCK
jgi:hypothetical protein